jgi:hypothetical protein
VKIRNSKTAWIFLLAELCSYTGSAQLTPAIVQQFLAENLENKPEISYKKGIQEFYLRSNYHPVWMRPENTTDLTFLLDNLSSAANLGLSEIDYE